MDLLLIRHARPERIDDADGPADPDLTDEGRTQAEALAHWLAAERVDAIYTSPMRRARSTAAPLAARLGLEPRVDDRFAEFDRHLHHYVPIEELRAEGGERWDQLVEEWTSEESVEDRRRFRRDVWAAASEVIAAHPGEVVAVVCHGGVVNAIASQVIGLDETLFFEPAYTSISRIRAGRSGHRQLISLNEAAHLRGG